MRILCWLVVATGAAFGQIDPDTITVVSRSSVAPAGPDTVSYDVDVTAASEKGLDEVLKVLAGVGVTERDLAGVSSSRSVTVCIPAGRGCNPAPALDWSFRFSSPVAKLPDTLKALAQPTPGMTISYSATSGGLSPAPECAYPTLISQARRHAENLAAVAGVRLGKITALSDGTGEPVDPPAAFFIPVLYDPIPAGFLTGIFYAPPPYIPTAACAVAVQFQLLR